MKKLFLCLLVAGSLFSDAKIEESTPVKQSCEQIMQTNDKELIAQSGCCSWHQGVCDCGSNGRVICCDGTYSPSCTCKGGKDFNDDVKVIR